MEIIIEKPNLPIGLYAVNPFLPNNPLIKIDYDQAWFWQPEWILGELEVEKEIKTGKYETFSTMEDFLESL